MKKYWIKLAGFAATAVVILLVVLGMVDLHTDGILVRDSYCIIRPNDMATYRMDVQGATNIAGTQVQLMWEMTSTRLDMEMRSYVLRLLLIRKQL